MSTSIAAGPDLDAWFRRYAVRLRGAARRIVGNDSDAEDATQDAFLAAFRARDRYHVSADPYPWLHRIATRKALTIVAAHRPTVEVAVLENRDPRPSAEAVVIAHEEEQRVREAIAAEPPLALHLLEDLRFKDVSERLGIPPATAATQIRRAKLRVRRRLAATNIGSERSKAP
jgi:RNA polymerase sigma-70 factor (ECF subfamily)